MLQKSRPSALPFAHFDFRKILLLMPEIACSVLLFDMEECSSI
jgi:hypothetical protein